MKLKNIILFLFLAPALLTGQKISTLPIDTISTDSVNFLTTTGGLNKNETKQVLFIDIKNKITGGFELRNDTLFITPEKYVNLSAYLDNTDSQDLTLSGNTLSLTGDASSVDLSAYLDNTDSQDLTLSGNTLSLTGDASSVDLSTYIDRVDTIGSYDELINYTGDKNLILVNHVRYFGVFYRVNDGTHNRITIVESNNGSKWKRLFDGLNFYDSWVEVDSSKHAIGETGVASNEWGAVLKAFQITGEGKRINLVANNNYYADQQIGFSGQVIVAEGVTINVANQKTSNPIEAYNGADTIVLGDASGFVVGTEVGICTGGGKNNSDLIAFASGSKRSKVLNVFGDTIVIESPVGSITTSDVVFTSPDVFSNQGQKGVFIGITFDGNLSNNDANYGWETGAIISSNTEVYIERCTFKNIVNVPIFAAYGYIGKNYVDSCGGGALVHFSQGEITDLKLRRTAIVKDNEGFNLGLFISEATHQESFVTISSSVYNLTVDNNFIRESGGGLLEPWSVDDNHLYVTNNKCYNVSSVRNTCLSVSNNVSGTYQKDIVISGNKFINAGNVLIYGGSYDSNQGVYRLDFSKNTIKNGVVFFQGVYGSSISGNLIFKDTSFNYDTQYITGQTNNLDNSLVVFRSCEFLDFSNNEILSTSFDSLLYVGVQMAACDNFELQSNKVSGFQIGLSSYNNSAEGTAPHKVVFYGNEVMVQDNSNSHSDEDKGVGIVFSKGNIVKDNIVISKLNSGSAFPLQVRINSNTNNSVTTVVGNLLYTDGSTGMYFKIGLNDDDEMIIAGNYGTCSTPANLIHPDFSGGVNTIISSNEALDSGLVSTPDISFPLYLNYNTE